MGLHIEIFQMTVPGCDGLIGVRFLRAAVFQNTLLDRKKPTKRQPQRSLQTAALPPSRKQCHLRCQPQHASLTQPVINHNNNHNEDVLDLSLVGPLPWERDPLGCRHQVRLLTLSQACAYASPRLMAHPLLSQGFPAPQPLQGLAMPGRLTNPLKVPYSAVDFLTLDSILRINRYNICVCGV